MPLTKLTLRDFQRHSHLVIELDEAITVVSGKTNSGKSAVLRALKWLCTNKPSGKSFIKKGEKESSVILEVDGHIIKRKRGTGNAYYLDGKKYEFDTTTKRAVPEPIESLLNLGEMTWAGQHSAPFWFDLTPGKLSQELNSIINLDLIDNTLANLASQLRKAKAEEDLITERLEAAKKDQEHLEWVPIAKAKLHTLEQMEKELADKRARLGLLGGLIQYGANAAVAASNCVQANVARGRVLELVEEYFKTAKTAGELWGLIKSAQNYDNMWQLTKKELATIESKLAQVKSCPVCGGKMKGK